MPVLTATQRERALGRLQAGERPAQVARDFGVHISTVYRLNERHRVTGTTEHRPRTGRPRITTARTDRRIARSHEANRFLPASVTARQTVGLGGFPICRHTVARRLLLQGLVSRRPYRGPVLTPRHRRLRLAWARIHMNWRLQHWRAILFTDEKLFKVDVEDRRRRVFRRPGERFNDNCVSQHDRWGGPRVMVWVGIAVGHVLGPVFLPAGGVTARVYTDHVLQPVVLPFLRQHPQFSLQQVYVSIYF